MDDKNPLRIVPKENDEKSFENASKPSSRTTRRVEAQSKLERQWLQNPQKMDPNQTIIQRTRLDRSWELLTQYVSLTDKLVVDVGCGSGVFAIRLKNAGAIVHALDLSSNALKLLKQNDNDSIITHQAYIPQTKLDDDSFDIVVSLDVIADLPEQEYRLYFAELNRLLKSQGNVLISTPIDIHSEDALGHFAYLAETEFQIDAWKCSYHKLYIQICTFFDAPHRFVKASKDNEYREKSINKRYSLSKWWFEKNSTKTTALFWSGISYVSEPISRFLRQSAAALNVCEKISKWLWSEGAISHVIIIGKRKPMVIPTNDELLGEVRLGKKEIWE